MPHSLIASIAALTTQHISANFECHIHQCREKPNAHARSQITFEEIAEQFLLTELSPDQDPRA